jgi:hypothetical protein
MVTVNRNNTLWLSASIAAVETVLIDTGVLPARTYTYQAFLKRGTNITGSSRAVQARTMDTTSHNAVWQIDTLGVGGGSVLVDVAIVNDTLAYAVGEMHLKDSTGQVESTPHNMALWNGQEWQLMRVPTQAFGGGVGNYPITTVISFGPNDIWTFSVAGSYSHWNGYSWTTAYVPERSGGGLKLWGTSSSNLYLVGTNGSISHYNGSSWQNIASGTTIEIRDIYGSANGSKTEILAIASTGLDVPSAKKLLQISGNTVTPVLDDGLPTSLFSLWFVPGKEYLAVGGGGGAGFFVPQASVTPGLRTPASRSTTCSPCGGWNGTTF